MCASSNIYACPELLHPQRPTGMNRTHLLVDSEEGDLKLLARPGSPTPESTLIRLGIGCVRLLRFLSSRMPLLLGVTVHAVSCVLFLVQGGGVFVGGTLIMVTSMLMANRANKEGTNLYLGAGSTTTYVLPAPPGYWVPATRCEVWREACDRGDSACQAAAASCKANPTDNVDNCNVTSSSCKPTTFNQPCDWQKNPTLLGKTVYVLPLGSHDLDYPFACAAGVLGGNGSLTSQQTSATCAGLCPAGFTCGAEATVTPSACPKGYYCPEGSSVALPCLPGSYSDATSLLNTME